jgi:hypothetical protein
MWLSLLSKALIRVTVVVSLAYVLHTCVLKQLANLCVKEDDGGFDQSLPYWSKGLR